MELYLAKLLGIYFIIIGIIMFVRRRAIISAVGQLMGSRGILFLVAILELAAGIGLVLAYPMPGLTLAGILSFIGYLMTIEGIAYMVTPARTVRRFMRAINRPSIYVIYAPFAIALGVYMAGLGFGHW